MKAIFLSVSLLLLGSSLALAQPVKTFSNEALDIDRTPVRDDAPRGNLIIIKGEGSDYISRGGLFADASGYFHAYSTYGNPDGITINYNTTSGADHYFTLNFSTRSLHHPLRLGYFAEATRAAFAKEGRPGIDISSDHRGCNISAGQFRILEASFDEKRVISFAAEFRQYCGANDIPSEGLTGVIFYNARLPRKVFLPKHPADPITIYYDTKAPHMSTSGNLGINVIYSDVVPSEEEFYKQRSMLTKNETDSAPKNTKGRPTPKQPSTRRKSLLAK